MERMNVTQAARNFSDLLNRVYYQGVSVELERNNKVIARIVPVSRADEAAPRTLSAILASLPKLGDDAEAFAEDVLSVRRELPPERSPWD
jgi:prevent-host-death family protein